MQVLAGDIGGTKALLALVEVDPHHGSATVLESRRYETRLHPGLEAVCRAFGEEIGKPLPRRAGFGVAGPVADGRCQATNLPWVMDERALGRDLGMERVQLVNDFLALGLGLAYVRPKDLRALNEGVRDPRGVVAVLGAGTGLGQCVVFTRPDGSHEVLPSEGGHCSFAPRDELEIGILRFLSRRWDHVSWERLLSGEGLLNIAEAISDLEARPLAPALVAQLQDDRSAAPASVTDLARGGDPLCAKALRTFCRIYGSEAGNLALKVLPAGGVIVAGGIAPRILPELCDGTFRDAFLAKGRMRDLLSGIPVHVVLDPLTPLYGAAAVAAADSEPQAASR